MSSRTRWDCQDTGNATQTTEMMMVPCTTRGTPMFTFLSTVTKTRFRASTPFDRNCRRWQPAAWHSSRMDPCPLRTRVPRIYMAEKCGLHWRRRGNAGSRPDRRRTICQRHARSGHRRLEEISLYAETLEVRSIGENRDSVSRPWEIVDRPNLVDAKRRGRRCAPRR